jgi:hypothetical protein
VSLHKKSRSALQLIFVCQVVLTQCRGAIPAPK